MFIQFVFCRLGVNLRAIFSGIQKWLRSLQDLWDKDLEGCSGDSVFPCFFMQVFNILSVTGETVAEREAVVFWFFIPLIFPTSPCNLVMFRKRSCGGADVVAVTETYYCS